MLKEKKILIGVTGSIAAYKIAMLTRLLVKAGAEVKIIMTENAKDFITPLTLSTLSKNPVYSSFFKTENGEWNNHVDLALWADFFVIAPASANTMAKMCNGICDSLLLATYLSAKCPVAFAPAMDLDMYIHPSTTRNIQTLISFGNKIINPGNGELASGLFGEGRMAEPEQIFDFLVSELNPINSFSNKNILITAGPTYEALDPVRFIGNHSSGKMGYEIALAFANKGANVTLVSGPSSLEIKHPKINLIKVQAAKEMFEMAREAFKTSDIAIMSAAVADYTPKVKSSEKIKKSSPEFQIELVKTVDILKSLGEVKRDNQLLIGFALETENEISNAKTKLDNKNADLIVLNSLKDEGAGFAADTNKISILSKDGSIEHYNLKSKKEVAIDILNKIASIQK